MAVYQITQILEFVTNKILSFIKISQDIEGLNVTQIGSVPDLCFCIFIVAFR